MGREFVIIIICGIFIMVVGCVEPPTNMHYSNSNDQYAIKIPWNSTRDASFDGTGGIAKPCENLTPEESSYYDRWLIQCMEIEPLPVSIPEPTPTPIPEPTPAPSLAREISNVTVNLPLSGNLTIALYQNEAGETCIESLDYFEEYFQVVYLGREFERLHCSGPPFNILTPDEVTGFYNNRVKWYSPGGEIYEGQLKEKNRRLAEEEFAKSKPKWDLDCRDDTCILTNIYNQSHIRYKVRNITIVNEVKS